MIFFAVPRCLPVSSFSETDEHRPSGGRADAVG